MDTSEQRQAAHMTPAQAERAAARDGWFPWFGIWLHVFPWEIGIERAAYFEGTARDLCLMYGLETGERCG